MGKSDDESTQPRAGGYGFLVYLAVILFGLFAFLVPGIMNSDLERVRALMTSFLFGSLVGMAEIASRYRDEPLRALLSPYGLAYILINGYLSLLAFLLIMQFPKTFPGVSGNLFLAAFAAGFGAMVVMRSRIAVIKTADGKDESIGPDYVLKIILRTVDLKIDRWRAGARQQILANNLQKIIDLGDFPSAWKYLSASLLAFQNLDETQKKMLSDTYNDYQAQTGVPEGIKQLALGFIFLTLVGEAHFDTVLNNAKTLMKKTQASSDPQNQSLPGPPKPPPDLDDAKRLPTKPQPSSDLQNQSPTAPTNPPPDSA